MPSERLTPEQIAQLKRSVGQSNYMNGVHVTSRACGACDGNGTVAARATATVCQTCAGTGRIVERR